MKKTIAMFCAMFLLFGLVGMPGAWAVEEEGPQWGVVGTMGAYTKDGHSALTHNGLIYLISGRNGSDLSFTYDPKLHEFKYLDNFQSQKYQSSSVVVNNKIYIIGGQASAGLTGSVEVFDLTSQSLTEVSPMPTPRTYPSLAVLNDKIYAISGSKTDVLEIYDTKTDTWTTGAPLPVLLSSSGCAVLNNKIYLFGGRSQLKTDKSDTYGTEIYCYDPIKDEWSQAGNLPQSLLFPSVSEYRNRALIIGGLINSSSPKTSNKTYIFNPESQTCIEGPSLSQNRYLHQTAIVDNVIYTLGGNRSAGGTSSPAAAIEALDLSQLIPPESTPKLSVLLNPNETVQLSVTADLADNAELTWVSSDSAVATVDSSGKVTAVAPGQCQITAKNAAGTFEESIPVKVVAGGADAYRLAVHLRQGQIAKLYLADDPTGITWQSLDPAIATVDSSGKITALADGLVLVQAQQNGKTHQIYVRVKA